MDRRKKHANVRRWWAVGLMATLAVVVVVAGIAVSGSTPRVPVVVAMTSPTVGVQARTGLPAPTPLVEPSPTTSPAASPTIAWTEPFSSERYGYAIRFPPGSKSSQGDGTATWDTIQTTVPPFLHLSIIRRPKAEMSLGQVAEATFRPRSNAGRCRGGSFGSIGIPVPEQGFRDAQIDERPALVRSECGFVDAVVGAGDDVLVIILRFGRRQPTEDMSSFWLFMKTLNIEDPSARRDGPAANRERRAGTRVVRVVRLRQLRLFHPVSTRLDGATTGPTGRTGCVPGHHGRLGTIRIPTFDYP